MILVLLHQNQTQLWLRWWDNEGNLLVIGEERVEKAEQKAAKLAARLREMGIDPDADELE